MKPESSSSSYELRFIQAGVDELKDYLLSDQIYWPVKIRATSGKPAYPPLTLGTLELFLHQAQALAADTELRSEVNRINSEILAIRSRWEVHCEQKAGTEFRARIKLWRDFLEEYRRDPEGNYDRYSFEVSRRAMLLWLQQAATGLPAAELQLLENLDRFHLSIFKPGAFIWDEELQNGFPKDIYWFLYGNLPKEWSS